MRKVSGTKYFWHAVERHVFKNNIIKIMLLPIILLMIISNWAEASLPSHGKNITKCFDMKNHELFKHSMKNIIFYSLIHYTAAWIYCFIFFRLLCTLRSSLIQQFVASYLDLDYTEFNNNEIGKISAVITRQTTSMCKFFEIIVINFFYDTIFMTICLYKVYNQLGKVIFLIFIVLFISLLIFIAKSSLVLKSKRNKQNLNENIVNHKMFDILRNYSIIKSFNNEDKEISIFSQKLNKFEKSGKSYAGSAQTLSYFFRIVMFVPFSILTILAFNDMLNNNYDGVMFSLLHSYYSLFKKRITKLKDIGFDLTECYADVTSTETIIQESINNKLAINPHYSDHIVFKDVSLELNGKSLFNNFNLTILKGEKIAITGRNGTGKSSIIKSLLGFYKVSGEIEIDGLQISSINEKALHDLIAYVPQDPHILDSTVIENLMYGVENLAVDEVVKICKQFGTHEMFKNLSAGYYTKVGEGGKNLSGGQCQILNFMRAVIKNTPIIVLDEPTSNLDNTASEELLENIFTHLSDKTILLSTHNPYHLSKFDKILNIKDHFVNVYDGFNDFYSSQKGNLYL